MNRPLSPILNASSKRRARSTDSTPVLIGFDFSFEFVICILFN